MRVLVVDDSRSMRLHVLSVLAEAGIDAVGAEDGRMGLKEARRFEPSVALLDIEMPDLSGLEVLQIWRNQEAPFAVLLFTTPSSVSQVVTGLDAGADDYITKPFKKEELIARVRAADRKVALERALAAARDQAEQRLAALRAAEAEIVHQGRRAGIVRLAAGVAHEVNNPLAFVRSNMAALDGYSRLFLEAADRFGALCERVLERDGDGDVEAAARDARPWLAREDVAYARSDASSVIKESADGLDRIASIVANIRSLDAINSGTSETFDLRSVVADAVKLSRALTRGRAEVLLKEGESTDVTCNAAQLKIAILHLIENAADAMPDGGEIRVSTHCTQDGGAIEVSDSGHGIAPEDLPQIFNPFFTTRADRKKLGFGLSIAESIVSSCGGRLGIKTTGPSGTTARIDLPGADEGRLREA